MRKSVIVVLGVLVLAVGQVCSAAVISTFASDMGAWFGDGGSAVQDPGNGADGQPGWAKMTAQSLFPSLRSNSGGYAGDLAAQHGEGLSEITVSLDLQVLGAAAASYTGTEFRIINGSTLWRKFVHTGSLAADTWIPIEEDIDTDWDNTTAQSNGWILHQGSLSFADTFGNVSTFIIDFQNTFANGDMVGFDNIAIDAIPEPASMGLMLLGGLAVLRRRRAD